MLRYLPVLFFLFFSFPLLTGPVLADPNCPESKSVGESATTAPDASPSPTPSSHSQEGATSREPSTTKDQIGLTFDPSSMPDKSFFEEEKNPERKRLLDKIFEAKKKEVDAQIRMDELDRLLKDNEKRSENVYEEDDKLFSKLDAVHKNIAQTSIFRSTEPFYKEVDEVLNALDVNWARIKGIEKQHAAFHQEVLETIKKWGDHTLERMGLEDSLGRLDDRQKADFHHDAERAPIPRSGQ